MEIADYKRFEGEGPMLGKTCWVVKPSVLKEQEMATEVKVPNNWSYINEKPKRASLTPVAAPAAPAAAASPVLFPMVSPSQVASKGGTGSTKKIEPKKEKKRVSIQSLFLSMSNKKDAQEAKKAKEEAEEKMDTEPAS